MVDGYKELYLIGLNNNISTYKPKEKKTILNTREIKLNDFQVHINWEVFNMKLVSRINV